MVRRPSRVPGVCSHALVSQKKNQKTLFSSAQQQGLQQLLVHGLPRLPQKVLDPRHRHVGGEVLLALRQKLADPTGQLGTLIVLVEPAVGKHQDAAVRLGTDRPPETLGHLADRIERQIVLLANVKVGLDVLQPGPDHPRQRVVVRDADHHHGPSVVQVKRNRLRDVATGHREKDPAPARVAGGAVVVQGNRVELEVVLGFHKDELPLGHFPHNAGGVPLANEHLHVAVGWKVHHHTVGDAADQVHQHLAVVPYASHREAFLVSGRHDQLVGPPGDHEGVDARSDR
mmetsp:Transcript_13987/g.39215  ORF Transcript_13987/g.39215 Transcript_13987/m.39215 type:complete len:286 (+) Transcript_13987:470-1327(+)